MNQHYHHDDVRHTEGCHRQYLADMRHFYPRSKPEGRKEKIAPTVQSTEPPPPSHEEIAEFVPLEPLEVTIDEA